MSYAPLGMQSSFEYQTLLSDFERPFLEVVRHRTSRRSFEEQPPQASILRGLEAFLQQTQVGPFGSSLRVVLCEAPAFNGRLLRSHGTYGFIKGARFFLVGAVTTGPWDLEDFGFVFELAILKATDLGLGTCWLGGTLDRSLFGSLATLAPTERLPAVSPVGHATSRRALMDQVVRLGARSARRKPFADLFFDGCFERPLTAGSAGLWAEALEAVRLAPSASNLQPWRVVREEGGHRFHFFRQRSRVYTVPDALGLLGLDLQRVDLGIALCHFSMAAWALRLPGHIVSLSPPPALGPLPPRSVYVASFLPEGQGP